MSLPPRWNLTIYEGDDYELPLFIRDKETQALLDVSTGTWTAAWRSSPSSASETTIPMNVTEAASGLVVVNFNVATNRAIAALSRVGWYDVQWNNTVVTKTYLRGTLKIYQDIER